MSRSLRSGSGTRLSGPLPRYGKLLFRKFGELDDEDFARILSNEKLYGNSQPRWKKAPTAKQTEKYWKLGVKQLHANMYQSLPFDVATAGDVIGNCQPGCRCKSNGCYLCVRAVQRWLVKNTRRLIKSPPNPGYQDKAFNFVFPAGQVPIGDLRLVRWRKIMRRCVAALENCGCVAWGILAFDVSFNDDTKKAQRGAIHLPPFLYWQVHLYGIIRTSDYPKVRAVLKALWPKDEKIKSPVKAKAKFNGSYYAISYLLKPAAFKRSAYWPTRAIKPRWQTGKSALKGRVHVEYLTASHQLGLPGRIGLINLHPMKTTPTASKPGGIQLRPVKPKENES